MQDSGIGFAVVHGFDAIESGTHMGDIDVVVDREPSQVIDVCRARWRDSGFFTILLWAYDIGGSTTAFVASSDLSQGVQLDMLFDPRGRGKYGIKSELLLADSEYKGRFSVVRSDKSTVYQIRKRHWKGQWGRVKSLAESLDDSERRHLVALARDIGSKVAADEVARILNGVRKPAAASLGWRLATMTRLMRRIFDPIGWWIHVDSGDREGAEATARLLADRMSGYIPHVAAGATPEGAVEFARWYLKSVASMRWRAGVFISWGEAGRARPDLRTPTADEGVSNLAHEMNLRFLA